MLSGNPTCTLLHLLLSFQGECQSLALLQGVCLHDPLYHWAAVHWVDVPGAVIHIALSPPLLMTVRTSAIPSELSSLVREKSSEVWAPKDICRGGRNRFR